MKGRRALLRRAARRGRAIGFTLIELMVVVVIIALLAVIALPSMSQARNDRLAWDYARQYQTLIHSARARAAGRGAAQLLIFGPGTAARGRGRQFEALDGTTVAGPNPVSSCKGPNQWANSEADAFTQNDNTARFVDFVDLNSNGVNVDMDVRTAFLVNNTATPWLSICFTPSGKTYVGTGGTANGANAAMRIAPPFNDVAEVDVTRNRFGAPVGLKRRVIIAGSSAPRLKAE